MKSALNAVIGVDVDWAGRFTKGFDGSDAAAQLLPLRCRSSLFSIALVFFAIFVNFSARCHHHKSDTANPAIRVPHPNFALRPEKADA